ncbi:MAG TPA: hypothetical protein VE397_03860 [Stellaceae bacterium]|jgi:uncharacterized lipoprotein YajG|nr:hypothetical protein [Stellaceae bacterium]
MPRLLLLCVALAGLAGCAGPTYTIEASTAADANARAQRYCRLQDATPELKGVEQQNGQQISVYRCIPGSDLPLQTLDTAAF